MGRPIAIGGIDNASYYRLMPDNPRLYINDTGCGNTLNVNHPRVLQMVMDSLRYWADIMKIDGFRFDLAPALGRESYGFDNGSGFFDVLAQDPILSTVKLIAEPWDIGPGGYQLGQFPCGWAEWNDRFRDVSRRFWTGENNLAQQMTQNIGGSGDLFNNPGRRPWASVNFVTSHDGFTLNDLVSYSDKHNQANCEDNRDGHSANFSANYGVEGATDNPKINSTRRRQQRNLLASLILSQGTPMLLAGDEFCHSQKGNNNAYCQDNETSWLNWEMNQENENLTAFVTHLIQIRKSNALLHWPEFLEHSGDTNRHALAATLTWLNGSGEQMGFDQLQDPALKSFGCLLTAEHGETDKADSVLLYFKRSNGGVEFQAPGS